jgi:hypothetical protein
MSLLYKSWQNKLLPVGANRIPVKLVIQKFATKKDTAKLFKIINEIKPWKNKL